MVDQREYRSEAICICGHRWLDHTIKGAFDLCNKCSYHKEHMFTLKEHMFTLKEKLKPGYIVGIKDPYERITTVEEFETIVNARIEKLKGLVSEKAKRYAVDGDRLYNFHDNYLGLSPEAALVGYVNKQLTEFRLMIRKLEKGEESPKEIWDEVIGDIITYMVLLEGLNNERFR